jgi:glutamyl-tRNA reductase
LTSGQLQNKKFKHLYFMNNTQAKAQALAEKYNGEAVAFCDMKEILTKVDISVCAVDAPHYILEKNTVQKIIPLRGSRPLLLIDISMPRNIEPEISEIELVSLFAIDDLKEVVDSNMKLRHEAVKDVEKIINTKISEYSSKIKPALNRQAQKIVPTV